VIRISTTVIRIAVAAVLAIGAAARSASADVVQDWNVQLLRVPSPVGPPQARLLAIMHVAMHDAINTITGEYETYGPAMNAPFGASPVAAGAAAAHLVLTTLVPANMIPNPNFDTALDSSLADIPEPERTLGVNVGREAARHILALRKDDGFTTVVPYTPGSGPGVWVPTPPAFAPALLPGFGKVLPFALHQNDQFRPDGPPSLTSEEYAADVNEVQQLGDANGETLGHRTHAQSATARFWLGNSIPIFQQLARKMSIDRGLDLSANARFFALLSIAGMDAYVAAWDAKFAYNFWRPVTAIRQADSDGNPATIGDPAWLPLATTPPFPDYVSGHTTYTGAFVQVLERLFGDDPVTYTLMNPNVPLDEQLRTYNSIGELSDEMIEARILAGIHFRTADRDGDRLGRQVAQLALTHVLREAH
jgi:vanadium-dependent haloperoxidase-like protein